ncbi:MAG: GTP-binding protein [Anaerolineales bacterium]|nr:MAG: GTP-binding protein [Anaerolineales bacterium]
MDREQGQFEEFVGRWGGEILKLWDSLSQEDRDDLTKVLAQLPLDPKGWKSLIESSLDHIQFAAGDKSSIAIVGPANAGKSTLYNQLIQSKEDRAKVSAVPGTTRDPQESEAGLFLIVDTPGADAAGSVGVVEKEKALAVAAEADVIVAMFDAAHGIREPEEALFQELCDLKKPIIVTLNKMDLIGKERPEVLGRAAAGLGIRVEQIIPLSAKKGEGLVSILVAIAKSEPRTVAALGKALPAYRWDLAQTAIGRASSTAAAIAITPLPFIDFIPLLGVQAALVLGIARIYGEKITMQRARELIVTFGAGMLGRTLFYELSKFGGPPGWILSAAVAAGTTVAVGYGAMVWFERGVKVSRDELKRISGAVGETLIERLKTMGQRRPNRKPLQDRVNIVLEDIGPPDEFDEMVD